MVCERRSRGWGGDSSDTNAIPQLFVHVPLWPVSNAYTGNFDQFGHVLTGLPFRRGWYYSGIRVVLPWALWPGSQPGENQGSRITDPARIGRAGLEPKGDLRT